MKHSRSPAAGLIGGVASGPRAEHAQVEDRDNVQAPDRPRRLAHVADRAGAKDGGVAMGDREDGAGQGGAMTEENGLRRACSS